MTCEADKRDYKHLSGRSERSVSSTAGERMLLVKYNLVNNLSSLAREKQIFSRLILNAVVSPDRHRKAKTACWLSFTRNTSMEHAQGRE